MKNFKYTILSLLLVLSVSSCDDYLDVNTDPDNPKSENASVDIRLPWIQNYYTYAWGTASMRACTIAGLLTQTSTTSANGLLAAWNPAQSSCTTVYQNFYLGAGVNIEPLIAKAEESGAYHYIGAAYCIKAMGFMMLLDLHGELPMTDAFSGKTNPSYDDGKTMFNNCIDCLDKAIEYFKKDQSSTAYAKLSDGDLWNGGDVGKWLKLCYGLKARYLLKLSKKSDLYNADDILAALENAPQSNADNTTMKNYNVEGDETNFTVGDPYQTAALWDCVAYGATQRETKWYVDLLTNSFSGGSGVIDPRMTKLVPGMMRNIKLNADDKIEGYEWVHDAGVDMMYSDVRQNGGPVTALYVTGAEKTGFDATKGGFVISYKITDATAREAFVTNAGKIHKTEVNGETVSVIYSIGSAYCNVTNYNRAGDTIYVNMRANSLSTSGRSKIDMFYYPTADYDYIAGTGTFYARPNSDTDILTYSEMCFIKAEVYLRKGDQDKALTAYKDGIKANFDRMQQKLAEWKADGTSNPDEMPMDQGEISAYMSSPAVCQSATDLTMADIMRQKIISMGFNLEIWNDMRRFNYSAGNIGNFGTVYVDYKRPQEFSATNKIVGSSPTDLTYWFRRFSQSTHESNYNLTQLRASNKLAMTDPIWSCPVWWDCSTDDEYYGYINK
ncbi:SusD/RagB family nutrient-binding outer membrane lipoprotein [uncultured Bacteroides sp.]|uniref:SusD/RagB family nutrient-binding outer membrane lipoprotein n=1 Tax=uncultured Bacteroides sp. TaxID=162156 RepID=UPI002AA76303|nr:SusD/RagB family nutrient-binding outer membrane lipoprotein [uncultured Bacteroides sp.]